MAGPVADLTGMTVIVAGAGGGGIGTCSCEAALAAGAEVVAVERSLEELDKLDLLPRPVVKVRADLTAPDAPAAVVRAALDAHGRIDGLINVAGGTGIDDFGPLVDIDHQGWDRVMANNLRYVAFLNREVARAMIDAGTGGAMVNVSSVSSLASQPFLAAYGAAKARAQLAHPHHGRGVGRPRHPGQRRRPRHHHHPPGRRPGVTRSGQTGHPPGPPGPSRARLPPPRCSCSAPRPATITGQVLAVDGGMSVKLAMLGDDNAPVFVADPEVRARMMGSDHP